MEGGHIMIVALTAIGCGTGIVITVVDKLFGEKAKAKVKLAEQELRLALERARQQDLRIADLSRQNEQLQKQLEWNAKLLDTQDRMIKQLGSGSPANGAGNVGTPERPWPAR